MAINYYPVWPIKTLMPVEYDISPDYRNTSGGQVQGGGEQVVISDMGRWRGVYNEINLRTQEQVKSWRAMDALTEGRAGAFFAVAQVNRRRPLPAGYKDADCYAEVANSDGSVFSDGVGMVTMIIDIRTSHAAEMGATTITVNKFVSGDLELGMMFFVWPYLYRIQRITAQDESSATLRVWPSLNADVPNGTRLDFDHPWMLARLETDDQMADLPLRLNRMATRSVSFVEALEEPEDVD